MNLKLAPNDANFEGIKRRSLLLEFYCISSRYVLKRWAPNQAKIIRVVSELFQVELMRLS